MDRAYIDYEKFEEMTRKGVLYVTKMKRNLKYNILSDTMYQTPNGFMEVCIQLVTFIKQLKGGETLIHQARIITYPDEKKRKLISESLYKLFCTDSRGGGTILIITYTNVFFRNRYMSSIY